MSNQINPVYEPLTRLAERIGVEPLPNFTEFRYSPLVICSGEDKYDLVEVLIGAMDYIDAALEKAP